MKKLIKNLDFFSTEYHLTYKGKEKFLTEFGGLMGILAIIIVVFNGLLIGKDIYFKENPTVLSIEKNLDYSPITRINYNNSFIGFILLDSNEKPFNDESYIKVIPSFEMFYTNKKGELKYKKRILEVTNCAKIYESMNKKPPFDSLIFNSVKCIKDLDTILSGSYKENSFLQLILRVITCDKSDQQIEVDLDEEYKHQNIEILKNLSSLNQLELNSNHVKNESKTEMNKLFYSLFYSKRNSSIEKVDCKSVDEIEKIIPKLYFSFIYDKISVNSKNYLEPMSSQKMFDWYILGNNLKKEIKYYFGHFVTSTDDGLVFNEVTNDQISIGYKQHSVDYTSRSYDDVLLKTEIYASNNVQYWNREYIKFQNIFANLGGIIKLVLFIFQIIYDPFFKKKLCLKIMNKIFEFEDNNFEDVIIDLKNYRESKDISFDLNNDKKQDRSNIKKTNIIDSTRFHLKNNRLFKYNFYKEEIKQDDNKNQYLKEEFTKFSNDLRNGKYFKKLREKNRITKTNSKVLDKQNEFKNLFEDKEKQNKLKYGNIELLKNLYFRCLFKNKNLIKKNNLFDWGCQNLSNYTDFLNIIKMHRDITKIKYLIFNPKQIKSFKFINNPKKFENGIYHHNNEFAEGIEIEHNKNETISEILEYYKMRIKCKNLDAIDEKLLDVIEPKIKRMIYFDMEN